MLIAHDNTFVKALFGLWYEDIFIETYDKINASTASESFIGKMFCCLLEKFVKFLRNASAIIIMKEDVQEFLNV